MKYQIESQVVPYRDELTVEQNICRLIQLPDGNDKENVDVIDRVLAEFNTNLDFIDIRYNPNAINEHYLQLKKLSPLDNVVNNQANTMVEWTNKHSAEKLRIFWNRKDVGDFINQKVFVPVTVSNEYDTGSFHTAKEKIIEALGLPPDVRMELKLDYFTQAQFEIYSNPEGKYWVKEFNDNDIPDGYTLDSEYGNVDKLAKFTVSMNYQEEFDVTSGGNIPVNDPKFTGKVEFVAYAKADVEWTYFASRYQGEPNICASIDY